MIPFAVVGSDHEYQVNGKRILGRKTKWGTIEGTGCCAATLSRPIVERGRSSAALGAGFLPPWKDIDVECTCVLELTLSRLSYFVPSTEGRDSGLLWGPGQAPGGMVPGPFFRLFLSSVEWRMGKDRATWKIKTRFVPWDQCGRKAPQRSRKLRLCELG